MLTRAGKLFALLAFAVAPASFARADLVGENNTFFSVDGKTRSFLGPIHSDITFNGSESGYGSGTIVDVNVSITYSKVHQIIGQGIPTNPFFDEIGFALAYYGPVPDFSSPPLKLVELIPIGTYATSPTFDGPDNSNPFDFINGTIGYDDESGSAFDADNLPLGGGIYRPATPLSALDGGSALGVWSLWIEDSIGGHPLEVSSWQITIETTAVPEPASICAGALALSALGVVAVRRRGR